MYYLHTIIVFELLTGITDRQWSYCVSSKTRDKRSSRHAVADLGGGLIG